MSQIANLFCCLCSSTRLLSPFTSFYLWWKLLALVTIEIPNGMGGQNFLKLACQEKVGQSKYNILPVLQLITIFFFSSQKQKHVQFNVMSFSWSTQSQQIVKVIDQSQNSWQLIWSPNNRNAWDKMKRKKIKGLLVAYGK